MIHGCSGETERCRANGRGQLQRLSPAMIEKSSFSSLTLEAEIEVVIDIGGGPVAKFQAIVIDPL